MTEKDSKRIVLIVTGFPQISETFIAYKVAALVERGWDIHVVCRESSQSIWDYYPELRSRRSLVKRIHINWPHKPRWVQMMLFPVVFLYCVFTNFFGVIRYLVAGSKEFGLIRSLNNLYLDARLIALRPDIIHFEFGDLAKKRMHLKNLLRCKITASFRGHELNFVGLHNPAFFQPIWDHADALHFLGKDLLNRAHKRGFDGTIQTFLIPPAIDSEYFTALTRQYEEGIGTTERPLRILSAARLSWTKGYEYGLQAVRILIDQGIHCEYRITGDGPYKEAILFTAHDLGLQERVTLMNFQTQSNVKKEMEWADVFLHASISEGFSNVVLEAQSMGLPVVCSDSDGLPENVENGSTGFVVPRRNPEAIAEKLLLLCRNAALRKQMGKAGRARVLAQFQLDDKIPEWERFFESALTLHTRTHSVTDTQTSPILS